MLVYKLSVAAFLWLSAISPSNAAPVNPSSSTEIINSLVSASNAYNLDTLVEQLLKLDNSCISFVYDKKDKDNDNDNDNDNHDNNNNNNNNNYKNNDNHLLITKIVPSSPQCVSFFNMLFGANYLFLPTPVSVVPPQTNSPQTNSPQTNSPQTNSTQENSQKNPIQNDQLPLRHGMKFVKDPESSEKEPRIKAIDMLDSSLPNNHVLSHKKLMPHPKPSPHNDFSITNTVNLIMHPFSSLKSLFKYTTSSMKQLNSRIYFNSLLKAHSLSRKQKKVLKTYLYLRQRMLRKFSKDCDSLIKSAMKANTILLAHALKSAKHLQSKNDQMFNDSVSNSSTIILSKLSHKYDKLNAILETMAQDARSYSEGFQMHVQELILAQNEKISLYYSNLNKTNEDEPVSSSNLDKRSLSASNEADLSDDDELIPSQNNDPSSNLERRPSHSFKRFRKLYKNRKHKSNHGRHHAHLFNGFFRSLIKDTAFFMRNEILDAREFTYNLLIKIINKEEEDLELDIPAEYHSLLADMVKNYSEDQ